MHVTSCDLQSSEDDTRQQSRTQTPRTSRSEIGAGEGGRGLGRGGRTLPPQLTSPESYNVKKRQLRILIHRIKIARYFCYKSSSLKSSLASYAPSLLLLVLNEKVRVQNRTTNNYCLSYLDIRFVIEHFNRFQALQAQNKAPEIDGFRIAHTV